MKYKVLVESVEEVIYSGPPMKFWTFARNGAGDIFCTENVYEAVAKVEKIAVEVPRERIKLIGDMDIDIQAILRE